MDQHKKTCYHCGEDTGKPTVINQYPLCDDGLNKGWKHKAFTIIAKNHRGKKAKTGVDSEVVGDAKEDDMDDGENKSGFDDDFLMEEKENDEENNEIEEEGYEEEDEENNGVKSDLISGSKKRNKKCKKTRNGYVSQADEEFTQMHGRGDFSSLPCNSFSNINLLLQADNRSRNGK